MGHIYLYSPSGAVRDRAGFKRALKRLQALGHEVELDRDALSGFQRFAGDDATRLAAIGRAAASAAQVLLCTRGGYGLTRLLQRLPYAQIEQSIERGSAWVGLSDFTALQLAVLARSGGQTWAGPTLLEDWAGAEEPDEIMQACFNDLLHGVGEGAGWRVPAADCKAYPQWAELAEGWSVESATLWGGNLSVLCSLLGTPYWPQIEGGILFLEDVAEHPYRIERMLTQLLHAGVLGRQRAILLGAFNRFQLTPHDRGFKLASVLQWLREQLGQPVPVLTGLPFGHVPTKVLLPVGRPVQLLLQGREALLFWG